MSLSDKSGDPAVVIEYKDGQPQIDHDRRFAVMTAEPAYDVQTCNLQKHRSFGGDQPQPGAPTPMDRCVPAAHCAAGTKQPADRGDAGAVVFGVIRNVSVPFGLGDPDRPNVASTAFRTVQDLTGQRHCFESTSAPNWSG